MRRMIVLVCVMAGLWVRAEGKAFRPPAVPLVACDPFFSIWSEGDKLTDVDTRHWTGKPHRLTSMVRVDGKAYRLMGTEPKDVPAMEQTQVTVWPTQTVYSFDGAGVRVMMTFITPALPDDLMVCARPVTYVRWTVLPMDGKSHAVQVYLDANSEITVNDPAQEVGWNVETIEGLTTLRAGMAKQRVLGHKGDRVSIDWGYLYLSATADQHGKAAIQRASVAQRAFAEGGAAPAGVDEQQPRSPKNDAPVLAMSFDLGTIEITKSVSRWVMLAYDQVYAIQYFKQNLRPYWRKDGADAAALLKTAAKEYSVLAKRCEIFDDEFEQDLTAVGGEKYAQIGALAWRQGVAGNGIAADANGAPLLFPKENTSNGCIGTVDVIYPMAPQWLLMGPTWTKAMIVSNLDYASSDRWKFPFAPHDLGTYPLANGQVYGGGEKTEDNQMPVEETGNMILLVAALAQMEGNADFAGKYWPVLTKWAEYLKAKGFDPENQLCTDDFAGHLAHNVNLSAKAIVALGAFGRLCEMRGDAASAKVYTDLAKQFAARWVKEGDEGDHFRLAFDKPGTWSQKYNLVWDRILGLGLFPDDVLRKEMAFYKAKAMQPFGVPLDNRKDYAKLDWSTWTATLTRDRGDFETIVAPLYKYLDESPTRRPMSDWYWTTNGKVQGFNARPVVGGVYLELLYHKDLWKKWASRDKAGAVAWAPLPKAPVLATLIPAADEKPGEIWKFTTKDPGQGWNNPGFDDSKWQEGKAGFGAGRVPRSHIQSEWKTADIWLRRTATLPAGKHGPLAFWVHHDEDVEIYVNGVKAAEAPDFTTAYGEIPMTPEGMAAWKDGANVVAVHCHQTTGGQYIDVGVVEVKEGK